MKPILFTLTAAFLITACGTGESGHSPRTATVKGRSEAEQDDGSTPPRVGMTKEQVRARYGRPFSVSVTSRGETWAYVFNNFDGTAFIPFYGEIHEQFKKRNSSTIFFGANGRVKEFSWNQTDPSGASIFR